MTVIKVIVDTIEENSVTDIYVDRVLNPEYSSVDGLLYMLEVQCKQKIKLICNYCNGSGVFIESYTVPECCGKDPFNCCNQPVPVEVTEPAQCQACEASGFLIK